MYSKTLQEQQLSLRQSKAEQQKTSATAVEQPKNRRLVPRRDEVVQDSEEDTASLDVESGPDFGEDVDESQARPALNPVASQSESGVIVGSSDVTKQPAEGSAATTSIVASKPIKKRKIEYVENESATEVSNAGLFSVAGLLRKEQWSSRLAYARRRELLQSSNAPSSSEMLQSDFEECFLHGLAWDSSPAKYTVALVSCHLFWFLRISLRVLCRG